MASLIKSGNRYYVQICNNNKHPRLKQIPTGTSSKSIARKFQKEIEAQYILGDYDPWEEADDQTDSLQYLSELISRYVEEKSMSVWSSNTIYAMESLFGQLSRKYGSSILSELDESAFNSFINSGDTAYATRLGYKAKLTAFLNWSFEYTFLDEENFKPLRINMTPADQSESINYFTPDDIDTLKGYISNKVTKDLKKGYQHENLNAMWLVDFIDWQRLSGMRLSETLNLRAGDINSETWEITIGNKHFATKSKKKQILPVESVKPLRELALKKLNECSDREDRLFGHSCRRATHRLFKKYLRAALPDKDYLNIHSLRHTCCIELLRAGVPIYTVQRWLRHADVKTTQRYADLLNMDISEQVGKAFR